MEEIKSRLDKTLLFYEQKYKLFILIPIMFFLLALIFLGVQYSTGDVIKKDLSLSGGVSATIYTDVSSVDIDELETFLTGELGVDTAVRKLTDFTSGRDVGVIAEASLESGRSDVLQGALEKKLDFSKDDITVEEVSAALGSSFFREMVYALIFAEIFIAIVVLIIFRTFIPSIAVVFSSIFDITMALTMISLFEIKLSTAGIASFLMIIGYSIDTDILLTTNIIKRREGGLLEKISGSLKTGLTMTLTTMTALGIAVIFTNSEILRQIFSIILIGLGFDLLSTWFMTCGVLTWYAKRNKLGK